MRLLPQLAIHGHPCSQIIRVQQREGTLPHQFLKVIPQHTVGRWACIEEPSVGGQGGDTIGAMLDQGPVVPFACQHAGLESVPFDGVADGLHQQFTAHHAFHEIILRPGVNRLCRQFFILHAREHHDGDVGRLRVQPGEGCQPVAIGQAQVEQHDIEGPFAQTI